VKSCMMTARRVGRRFHEWVSPSRFPFTRASISPPGTLTPSSKRSRVSKSIFREKGRAVGFSESSRLETQDFIVLCHNLERRS